jgi:fatty-acyl-CoA synthase
VWAAEPILIETLRSEGWDDLPPNCEGWDGDPGWSAQDDIVLGPDRPALIQFTSGSTLSPRGCCLSQRAVLANVVAGCEAMAFREEDLAVSWIPLYHDMGLIGAVVVPVVSGRLRCVLLGPEEFVVDPMLWLRASARHRASILAAPNFAFSMVVRRLRGQTPDLDLQGVRAIVNGAEPIDPDVVRDFLRILEPCGLSPAAMWPSWGLAENTVLATICKGGMRLDRVDRQCVERKGWAVPASKGAEEAEIVCLGKPVRGTDLRVVDEDGGALPERYVGDIELRSTSLMDGYFEEPGATSAAFRDGWLRTGDVGYLAADELYIVGRRKDLVIVGGRNIAPQDVERVVDRLADVRPGCTVAFGVRGEAGTEELVVVVEVRGAVDGLCGRVARVCRETLDVIPRHVAVAEAGQVSKTSSGKLQRHRARALFLRGAFRVLALGR